MTITPAITLAQISDTHLLADKEAQLRGCNPLQSMQAVLQQALQAEPDGLLLTGDLAHIGEVEAYKQLQGAIAPLGLPAYWLPGNHDDIEVMQTVLNSPPFDGLSAIDSPVITPRAIDLGAWQLLMLSSVLPQAQFGEGYVCPQTLQWLQTELHRYPDKPTAIALHHHPVPINIDWVDQMQVQNASDLLFVLDSCPQVKLVTFGHIHLDFCNRRDRPNSHLPLFFYGCPSTHLQVTTETSTQREQLPGFRLFHLYADGTHQTQVQRLGMAHDL
ncbi:MAG: phosphodiesterase [Cyanobacteria bacterium J06649_4]